MPDSATRLSGRGRTVPRFLGHFEGLARLSLVLAAVAMLSGCLVEDPPSYTAPTRTPPRLNLPGAFPPPDQVWVTEKGKSVPFEIPVSSEDDGIGLLGFLLVDYDGADNWLPWGERSELPASTLDDDDRKLQFNPTVGGSGFALAGTEVGCHRVTLRVSHRDNYQPASILVVDRADVAEAYWTLNVIDPNVGDVTPLSDCPQASVGNP